MKIKQLAKSKTLDFNAGIAALAALAMAFGIEIPAEVTTAVVILVNFILRFFTRKPLSEK